MHSNNSTDGKDSIMKMSQTAVNKGLNEIAISDHFEPTLGNEAYPWYNAEKIFSEIREANELLHNKIKIKAAVELGQPHLYPEHSTKLIETYQYDYVLASAHKMADNTDFSELHYTKENLDDCCSLYLTELENLTRWNKFDCLGHLDLVKRYSANFHLRARLMDYQEKLEHVLKMIIYNGKGIEINTSGLRQTSRECLPDFDIISFYRQLGGEIITIGSDAHNCEDIGKGVLNAIELLAKAGFHYITVFENRMPSMLKITDNLALYTITNKSA